LEKNDIEDKAKAVLPKERLVVADFKVLLCWKLGDEFSSIKDKGVESGWVESIVGKNRDLIVATSRLYSKVGNTISSASSSDYSAFLHHYLGFSLDCLLALFSALELDHQQPQQLVKHLQSLITFAQVAI
jgi:hypothetical protein